MTNESPQCENGYTRIANELLDAIISAGLSKRELTVTLQVIRQTYGYNKKSDDLSVSRLAQMCGMSRPHVSETLTLLSGKKIVLKRDGRFGYLLGINKKYREWGVSQNGTGGVPKRDMSQNGTGGVPKRDTPKDNPPKDKKHMSVVTDESQQEKRQSPPDWLLTIVGAYGEICPHLPQPLLTRWSRKRSGWRDGKSRWDEDERHQSREFWLWFFSAAMRNPFWGGQTDGRGFRPPNLDWFLKRSNFDKILEAAASGERGVA